MDIYIYISQGIYAQRDVFKVKQGTLPVHQTNKHCMFRKQVKTNIKHQKHRAETLKADRV